MTQKKIPHLYYKCRKCGAVIVGDPIEVKNPELLAIHLLVNKEAIIIHECPSGIGIADTVGIIYEYTPEKESEV